MLLSIIIPAYKQEKTILKDISNIFEVMSNTRWDFELIIVVDGEVDNTFKEAVKFKKDNVFVYGYKNNKGKGYAVRYGMAKSNGEYVSFIDAGMDIDPNGISMLLEHMQWYDADIVVGSKRHPVSQVNYPFIRKIYSFLYYLLCKVLFNLKLKDTQTGLKVFKKKVLVKVLPRLVVKQFAFDIEVLAVANYLGFNKIYEAPVKVNLDLKNSNFSALFIFDSFVRRMLLDTLGIFYRMRILKYYDDDSKRKWVYDKDLEMRVNTGELLDK